MSWPSEAFAGDAFGPPPVPATGADYAPITRDLHAQITELSADLAAAREAFRREQAERRALARRLDNLCRALPAALILLDGDGCILAANPAAEALFERPLQGTPWREVAASCFAPETGQDLALRNGRLVSLSTCPLGDDPGQILLFHEVTDSRRLQAHLARQERLVEMGQMAATLAHQIRTPLASALLYASQLAGRDLGEAKRERFGSRLLQSLRGLERLVNDMLIFARGGGGGAELLACADLLAAVNCGGGGQGTSLSVHSEEPDLFVRGNRALLVTAMQNLVDNALRAAGPQGTVEVSARLSLPDSVELAVRDTGPGIDEAVREKLFQPFVSGRSDGTGLGLAVVQAVVRAHEGEIGVESRPGRGSTFTLRLPRADVPVHARAVNG